jgi:hypothetical protein
MSREITPAWRPEGPSDVGPIEGSQSRRAERQRGRWNFLTWSFFLAEVAAGAQFLGTVAKAAQDDDSATRSTAHSDSTSAIYDGVLGNLGLRIAAADDGNDGGSGAAAPQTEAQLAMADLNFLGLQDGEPGAPLSNAGHGGLAGASSSGSGTSGTGSNGTSQTDSGGSPPISEEPPSGISPPISDGPPSGISPPISGDPPLGGWPPISDDPPLGGWPPISDGAPSGVSPPISESPSTGMAPLISVGGTVSLLLDTTLDELTGLHLVETVAGLLGDTVGDTLSQITGLVGNAGELTAVVGGLLDNSLNVAFSATESLIPQAAGSLAPSLGTLVSTTGDLGFLGDIGQLSAAAPALEIVSDAPEIAPLAHDQDVSSGGTISFPDLTSVNVLQVDELFAGGRYTDYGLAVQSEVNSSAATFADTLSGETDDSSLNSPIDSPTDSHDSALLPGVQDVNASSVSLPSIIEELGVRDLSI